MHNTNISVNGTCASIYLLTCYRIVQHSSYTVPMISVWDLMTNHINYCILYNIIIYIYIILFHDFHVVRSQMPSDISCSFSPRFWARNGCCLTLQKVEEVRFWREAQVPSLSHLILRLSSRLPVNFALAVWWSVVNIPRISKRNIMSKSTNQLTKWSNVNQNQLSYINYHKQSLITLITLITSHPCCQVDASTPLSHVETKPPQFVVPPGTQNVGRTWKSIQLWNIVIVCYIML